MVKLDKLRFVCTRCGNCCTDKNTIVNVTYLDIMRIIKRLKLNFAESLELFGFYVYEKSLTSHILEKMVISPIKTEKGFAFIGLLKNNQGICCFYDQRNKKCLIYELRPIFCRSFPFTFCISEINENTVKEEFDILYTEKAKKYCEGIGSDAPLIDIDQQIELGRNIIEDLKKNHIFNEDWNTMVSNKQISPSAKNFLKKIFDMIDTDII